MFRRMLNSCVFAAALLCGGGVGGQDGKLKFSEELIPRFNIPMMGKPPTIDGRINADEWGEAAKVMGMVNTSSLDFRDRPISFWLGWDADHLYIAARSDVLPGHRMYRSHRERHTTGVVCDDTYELGIFMHDRNKLPNEVSSYLKIVLNAMGSGEYMKLYPSIGQNMYNWQPDPKIGNSVYEADGRKWWDMELALDLKDLQLPGPNKPGDKIDILLAADLKNPGWQWLDFPSASGHLQHYGFPRCVLTKDQPYIQVEELSGLHDERLHLKAVVNNPSDAPVSVKAAAKVEYAEVESKTTAKVVLDEAKTLSIPARGSARFDIDKEFPGLVYDMKDQWHPKQTSSFSMRLSREDQPTAEPVYTFDCTFYGTKKDYLKAVPRTTIFEYDMQFNPVSNKLQLAGDTLDAQFPAGAAKPAAMAYAVDKEGKVIKEGRITQFVHYKYEDLVELPSLAEGKYRVTLSFVDKDGKVLLSRDDISFEKKDEAKVFAEWWNNKIGDTEKVLTPFEALNVKQGDSGISVTCARREYQFDGLGMPRQIVANNGGVLTRPAQIVVTVGGKEHVVPTAGKLAVTSAKAWRVEFAGQSEAAGIAFTVKGWMEQDGLVNLELTYAPKAGPVAIDNLRVEWPVDGALGSWMTCIGGTGGNYSARTIGKVPEGQGPVWNTLDGIGKMGSTMLIGNFMTNLWIGNEFRGLLWSADTDQGWVPNDKTPAHSLIRKDKEVAIHNNLINLPKGNKPFTLDAPRVVQLQYNATPFRDFAKGWRLSQVSAANGFASPEYKTNKKTKQEYFSILSMPSTDVKEWPEYYAAYKEKAAEISKKGWYNGGARRGLFTTNQIALRGYMDKTTEPGLYDYFRADWVPGNESLNKSYTDYMVHLMNRQVREGGCTHFYFDISFSRDSANPIAGFGYRLPDGRVQPGSNDGTLREWYKRTWAMMLENNQYPGGVSGHATNSICLRALPWADAILDSEYPMTDPILTYPPDRMIALSCPHSFGVNISHLGFMNPNWAVMHDAGMGGDGGVFNSQGYRHFGITADDVRFVPYWRNEAVVKKIGQGLFASVWTRPGKAVVAVINYGLDPEGQEKTRQAELTLDFKALGVPAGAKTGQLRVSELDTDGGVIADRYLGIYKWVKEMPDSPHPRGWHNVKVKLRPPATPILDPGSGALSGFDIFYHDVRYILVTWDEKPADETALKKIFPDAALTAALEWGVNRPEAKQLSADEVGKAVKVEKGGAQVQAWKQPGTIMLLVKNPSDKPVEAALTLDLDQLGVKVNKLWAQFTQCVGGELVEENGAVTVKGVKPGEATLVFIDTF